MLSILLIVRDCMYAGSLTDRTVCSVMPYWQDNRNVACLTEKGMVRISLECQLCVT